VTAPDGGVRPAAIRPATESTVLEAYDARRPRHYWRPDSRNVRALDRHIESRYGPEYVRGRAA
jgi:hypothetical protein